MVVAQAFETGAGALLTHDVKTRHVPIILRGYGDGRSRPHPSDRSAAFHGESNANSWPNRLDTVSKRGLGTDGLDVGEKFTVARLKMRLSSVRRSLEANTFDEAIKKALERRTYEPTSAG
jgi:hypothetical protein